MPGAPPSNRTNPESPPNDETPPSAESPLPRRLRQVVVGLLVLGIVAFLIVGADRPANPRLLPPNGVVKEAAFRGFGATSFNVVAGRGLPKQHRSRCALWASSSTQRDRGLRGQKSLHGFAGMIFSYGSQTNASVRPSDILIPLTAAWFDSRGRYITSYNIRPCPTGRACPSLSPGRTYLTVFEVPEGKLASIGIGPGSSLELSLPCSG